MCAGRIVNLHASLLVKVTTEITCHEQKNIDETVQEANMAGKLTDSKSTLGEMLCLFGDHPSVPVSWTCDEQTSVSHSSVETDVISLDIGLRVVGLLALTLWDIVIDESEHLASRARVTLRVRLNPKHHKSHRIPLTTLHQTRNSFNNHAHC